MVVRHKEGRHTLWQLVVIQRATAKTLALLGNNDLRRCWSPGTPPAGGRLPRGGPSGQSQGASPLDPKAGPGHAPVLPTAGVCCRSTVGLLAFPGGHLGWLAFHGGHLWPERTASAMSADSSTHVTGGG